GITANLTSSDFSANSGTLLSNYVLPSNVTGLGTILPAPAPAPTPAPAVTQVAPGAIGTATRSLHHGKLNPSTVLVGQPAVLNDAVPKGVLQVAPNAVNGAAIEGVVCSGAQGCVPPSDPKTAHQKQGEDSAS
ncbi:hypothetical protein HF563_19070, partial [Acidithiobacillus ferridurans]|nr:hypothetical protein [Acidithiobacillus ferridurans]